MKKPVKDLADQEKKSHRLDVMNEKGMRVGIINADLHWIHSKTLMFKETLSRLKSEKAHVDEEYEKARLELSNFHAPFPELEVRDSLNFFGF